MPSRRCIPSRALGTRTRRTAGPEARVPALVLAAVVVLASLGIALAADPPATAAEPGTESEKTVSAADYDPGYADSPFPNLKVTVSQTENLIQQGIRVSWTGGKASTVPLGQIGGTNFLQIMQCWGDEPGSGGTRPDRTTCQYGGFNTPGATRWSNRTSDELAELPEQDAPYTVKQAEFPNAPTTGIPFRSATGKTLYLIKDGKRVADARGDVLYNNEFYTKYTTNEVSWAGSGANGAGSVSFELQTAQQSPGLGCGTPSDDTVNATGSSCWLVIVPRGETDPAMTNISRSGLFWDTWKHHIAIRLKFKPLGLHCAIGAAERQLSGSELVLQAIGQWQPTLCGKTGGAVYSLLTGPESDAVSRANADADAPLALTSRALDVSEGGTDSLAYAPIALTGVSVAFAIDHYHGAKSAPEEVAAKDRQAFESLKLNPRLLAKLLTASYTDAVPRGADKSHLGGNPSNVTKDPEFLAINDAEWKYMDLNGVGVSDVLIPLGRYDAAVAVWKYILADADARAFLAGEPDEYSHMKVNPYYSTTAVETTTLDPEPVPLELPRDDFPKADPVEFRGSERFLNLDVANLVTWRPYTSGLDVAGYLVLRGDAQLLGDFDPTSTPPKYGKAVRDLVGQQQVMGLTGTAASARYQVVQASLLNPAGEYVAPTTGSLAAAAAAMTAATGQPQVVGYDPTSQKAKEAKAAYPLAMPVYAAANPAGDDQELRTDYANFITYAVTDGQNPGTDDGELPPGYASLPAAWKAQALAAAAMIKAGPSATPTPTATPTTTPRPSRTPSASSTPRPSPTPTPTPTPTTSSTPSPTSLPTVPAPSTPPAPSSSQQTDPPAGGQAAPPLTGATTPDDPAIGGLGAVIPATGLIGLAAVLGIPAVSRARRLP